MKIIIDLPDEQAEKLVRSVFDNFPEASAGSALQCVSWKYDEFKFVFHDEEEDKDHVVRLKDALRGLDLFLKLKGEGKWPGIPFKIVGEHQGELEFDFDALTADAIAQLAIFGEVIYG